MKLLGKMVCLYRVGKMSELEEAKLHDEVILMWMRNTGKPYIITKIMKRMYKCLWGQENEKIKDIFRTIG